MKKSLKILMSILMIVAITFTFSNVSFANGTLSSDILDNIGQNVNSADVDATGLTKMAGQVIKLIQMASVILATILIAVFGFKFIMGSANEKADYQKSFIPLIVGLVVVFAATSIARLIMSITSVTV